MFTQFQKAPTPSYLKSPSGLAKNYPDPTASDCQWVCAVLKRAGVGAMYLESAGSYPTYNAGAFAGTNAKPTGPLLAVSGSNNVRGDLYRSVQIQLTWSSGATCTRSIEYDVEYGDMSITDTYSWQSGSTQTNVTAAYDQLMTFDTHPTAGTGFSYERTGSYPTAPTYSQTVDSDGTHATLTWSGGTDNSGIVHYGATLTIILGNLVTYTDYADTCEAILDQVTFNDEVSNPTKTYSVASSYRGAASYYLRWLRNWNTGGSPNWTYWTTNLIVRRSRSTGYDFSFLGDTSVYTTTFSGNAYPFRWIRSPWNNTAYITGGGAPIFLPKNILCAYGMPSDLNLFFGLPEDLSPATQSLLSPYLVSIKTRFRSDGDLAATGKRYIHNPSTNTWTTEGPPVTALPSGIQDKEYSPALMGSNFGYIISQIEKPRYCRPFYFVTGTTYAAFQTIVKSLGQTHSFQSVTTNKNLGIPGDTAQAIENVAATWSLVSKTGTIVDSDLAVAPDGKSAIFTANHSGTCRLKCVYPNTESYTPLITVP